MGADTATGPVALVEPWPAEEVEPPMAAQVV